MSAQQQKDQVRFQLDQVNTILEKLNYKDQVTEELIKMQSDQGDDDLKIYGNGPTLLQEYQKQV